MNGKILTCFLLFTIMASLSVKSIEADDLAEYVNTDEGDEQKRLIEFKRIIDFKRDIEDELKEIATYQERLEELRSLLANNHDHMGQDKGMRSKRPSVYSGTRSMHGTRSIYNKD